MVADIGRLHGRPGVAAQMTVEIEADSLIGIGELGLMEGDPISENGGKAEDEVQGEGDQGECEAPVDEVCHRSAFPRPKNFLRAANRVLACRDEAFPGFFLKIVVERPTEERQLLAFHR